MTTLATLAPEFASEVASALTAKGQPALVAQLSTEHIERCMYDPRHDAGYICLSRSRPIPNLVRPVDPIARTLFFLSDGGFNIDVSGDGRLLGIEFVGHGDLVRSLREANAL